MGSQRWSGRSAILLLSLLLSVAGLCSGGVTSSYRRKLYGSDGLPMSDFPPPPGYNAPEQVHITQGDYEGRGVIISWVNPNERDPSYVTYWKADGEGKKHKIQKHKKHAETKTYKYFNYKSGFIQHATIENLEYDTKYIYELGEGQSARQFSFVTPPEPGPDVPYTFGLMGDLGQTADSNKTLEHYINNPKNAQALLFAGDLSYADHYPNHDNRRWDTWGRFVEKSNAYQPWIWAAGNHELDLDQNIGEMQPFKPYLNRYHVPYKAAGSESPLWYSFRRGPAHIIVLSSYSSSAKYTLQHTWFWNELKNKVNRTITPWVIVVLHTPWYNTNGYHYMEGENMRVVFEPWVVDSKVDLIIAGHVHSYERSYRVSNVKYNITNGLSYPIRDPSAPVYITIGDGGNEEGIANQFTYPQPNYSAFREASFGHAILEIKNRTHACYSWFRNQDAEPVVSDSTWFFNRYYFPNDVDH